MAVVSVRERGFCLSSVVVVPARGGLSSWRALLPLAQQQNAPFGKSVPRRLQQPLFARFARSLRFCRLAPCARFCSLTSARLCLRSCARFARLLRLLASPGARFCSLSSSSFVVPARGGLSSWRALQQLAQKQNAPFVKSVPRRLQQPRFARFARSLRPAGFALRALMLAPCARFARLCLRPLASSLRFFAPGAFRRASPCYCALSPNGTWTTCKK